MADAACQKKKKKTFDSEGSGKLNHEWFGNENDLYDLGYSDEEETGESLPWLMCDATEMEGTQNNSHDGESAISVGGGVSDSSDSTVWVIVVTVLMTGT